MRSPQRREQDAAIILEKLSAKKRIPVKELIKNVLDDSHGSYDDVLEEIIRLHVEGRVQIVESRPSKTFPSYLFSIRSLWFWELITVVMTSLGLVLASSGALLYVRYLFGGFLVLILPGYTFVKILYPKGTEIDSLTRGALSFVMSLAIVTLVGFLLNYTPFGLTIFAVAFSIGILTCVMALLAAARKYLRYKLTTTLTFTS